MPGTKIAHPNTGEIIYTPPEGEERIRRLLKNWEDFIHGPKDDLEPLIRMAVMHYQFEAIHPFTDGNGRTGRILNILYLIQEGLLDVPVLYLSRYILQNRSGYYRLLRGVTEEQRWENWILYMLDAVEDTARWTTERVSAIRALYEHTREYIQEREGKMYSRELVDALFNGPFLYIDSLVNAGLAKRETASKILQRLVKIGVMEERPAGKRKLFVHTKFWDLLQNEPTEFAKYDAVPE